MKEPWKYTLAFFAGMTPLAAVSYVIFCGWLSLEVQIVAPKFGVFAAMIGAIYWSVYCIRGIRLYRKRVRYTAYILFVGYLIFAGLLIWWSHPGSGVSWLTSLTVFIITAACIGATLWLFYRNATRRRIGMRPDDVE